MTGFIGAGISPLSVVTLASLADQGYQVDFAKADVYTLGMALQAFERGRTLKLEKDILRRPIRKVDIRGRVTGTLR
jgi:hypothetical protein